MFYLLVVFLVIIDLVSKKFAFLNLRENINLIWDFFYLKYVENTWIAFSIWLEWIILKIVTIVLISLIFYYYFTEEKKKNKPIVDISFAMILGWALWNWYERVFNWKVIDFIGVKYFAVFNLADVFISLWVFLYILYMILEKKKVN